MSVVINYNSASAVAANNLAVANEKLQNSINRLSSGSKIVGPADDAGGLAVSMKLSAKSASLAAEKTNLANATSYLQTQDGAMKTASAALKRMTELNTLNLDITKSSSDKALYATEFTQLSNQLTAISGKTFNGNALFGSGTLGTVNGVTVSNANLSAVTTVTTIGTDTTAAINALATQRATNGAAQNRLAAESEIVTSEKTNLEAANSRIVDVDVAEESTQLARWNILVQSGTAMLSQANGTAQTALKLLQ